MMWIKRRCPSPRRCSVAVHERHRNVRLAELAGDNVRVALRIDKDEHALHRRVVCEEMLEQVALEMRPDGEQGLLD